PPRWLRNPHLQSMLSSSSLRRAALRRRAQLVAQVTRAEVLHLDAGVRLQGFHSVQQALPQRHGLVLLLHGWEGSADSNYMQATSACLLRAGYDVYRLNFRDHGDSHALNVEPFHSCRLDEVAAAAAQVCARPGAGLRAIAGFSLGGNFALRVARAAPARGIELDYAWRCARWSIRPRACANSNRAAFITLTSCASGAPRCAASRCCFRRARWCRARMALNMRGLTRALVLRYTEFGTLEAYLDGYSIAGDRLAALQVPATILTAADDPVIPVADFRAMQLPDCVELDIAAHGGHCGFLTGACLHSFVEGYLIARLHARAAAQALTPPQAARRA
ncbi:hydrolase of the alpha/beta fold superfamily protein, partial [mine drainage metagenome]